MNRTVSIINGVRYEGSNVSVVGGKIFVNGKDVTPEQKHISITIEGDCESLDVDSCEYVNISGNVKGNVKTMSGNVKVIGDVSGSVSTMSGDVEAKSISGNSSTMSGDIITR